MPRNVILVVVGLKREKHDLERCPRSSPSAFYGLAFLDIPEA
jgi:hypothetical protein